MFNFKKIFIVTGALAASTMLLTSCASQSSNQTGIREINEENSTSESIEESYWTDENFENIGANLTFAYEEGKLVAFGSDGCNNGRSMVTTKDATLEFDGFASTMMACMDLNPQPWLFQSTNAKLLGDDILAFYSEDGEALGQLGLTQVVKEEIDEVELDGSVSNSVEVEE